MSKARCVRATDLRLTHQEDLTPHYATTLAHWGRCFLAAADQVRALGFADAFVRRWERYFCYCEGWFLERNIGVVQQLLEKPLCRVAP